MARSRVVTLAVMFGLACTRPQHKPAGVEPRVDERLDSLLLYTAETVVLGEVTSLTRLADSKPSVDYLGSYIASIRVLEQIQGNAPGTLQVYFFANPGGGNGGLVRGRDRVAFFSLNRQGQLWRFVRDNQDSYIATLRTTLPPLNVTHNKTSVQRIADILLAPVGDHTDGASLSGRALEAYNAAGFSYTRKLLQQLLVHRSSNVRLSACLALADHFFGGLDCIPDEGIDPELEHRIRMVRHNRMLLDAELDIQNRYQTFSPPLIVSRMPWAFVSSTPKEWYEAMAQSSDQVIASYGLRALRKEDQGDQQH